MFQKDSSLGPANRYALYMMAAVARNSVWVFLLFSLTLLFQNCGQPIGAPNGIETSSSSQCKAAFKAEAKANLDLSQVQCADFNQYICERRIFQPGIANLSHSIKECAVGGETCVDVNVVQFDTEPARAGSASEEFQKGGEYNREELRCAHKAFYKGRAVFDGEGSSLEEALAAALNACEEGLR